MRRHLIALLFYGLLAFITLHPMLFNNGTHAAGYDYFHFHWNFWWIRHAITTPGLEIFESSYVLFPFENNLSYHTLSIAWYPAWALLEPVIGTFTAMNVIIFVGCVLNGYVFFLLLRRENVAVGLALLFGAALQVTPLVRYFYYNTHINLLAWFWLPLHLILWGQIVAALEEGRVGRSLVWALVQGIGLWGMILTDLQFPIFLAFLLVPYALLTLGRSSRRGWLLLAGMLAVGVGVVLLWFAGPLPYVLEFPGTGVEGRVEERPGIPFPRGYLSVDAVWWWWNVPTLGGFVAFMLLAALILSLTRWRKNMPAQRWVWFVLMLPPFVLSLGPTLTLGSAEIALPFRWLYNATSGMFGMPWRLAPVYIIAGLLFAGMTLTPVLRSMQFRLRPFVLAGIMLLLALSLRMFQGGPVQPILPEYDFYQTFGAEDLDYVILEVPTGAGTGEVLVGDERVIAFQLYALQHEKRLINGFLARAPIDHYFYLLTDDPLLSWLGQRRELEPDLARPQLARIIDEWPVGYVVVHQDYIGLESAANREVLAYLNRWDDLLCPVIHERNAVVYRTGWHPAGCPPRTPPETEPGVYTIDIGRGGDEFYIGPGWYWQESIGGISARWLGADEQSQAVLHVDLPPGRYEVTIAAQSFEQTRELALLLDGERLGRVEISPDGLQTVTFDLVSTGDNLTLTLDYGEPTPAPGERTLALLLDYVQFRRMD